MIEEFVFVLCLSIPILVFGWWMASEIEKEIELERHLMRMRKLLKILKRQLRNKGGINDQQKV